MRVRTVLTLVALVIAAVALSGCPVPAGKSPNCLPNCSRADLSGVNLREVDLSQADLSDANLGNAVLHLAHLTGANLSGALPTS